MSYQTKTYLEILMDMINYKDLTDEQLKSIIDEVENELTIREQQRFEYKTGNCFYISETKGFRIIRISNIEDDRVYFDCITVDSCMNSYRVEQDYHLSSFESSVFGGRYVYKISPAIFDIYSSIQQKIGELKHKFVKEAIRLKDELKSRVYYS